MLKSLPEHIEACYRRSAESHKMANQTVDENLRQQYMELERQWIYLARCYEFVGSLERFVLDSFSAEAMTSAEAMKRGVPKHTDD